MENSFFVLQKKIASNSVLIIALLLLLLLSLNTPLWGNILLGFGALFQAGIENTFPKLIFEADYIRGFVYKYLLYTIMNITDLFTDRTNFYLFQQISKTIYYLFCMAGTFFIIKTALKNFNTPKIIKYWALFWIMLLLSGYRQFMEAEELAIIFTFCHFLFIKSNNRILNNLSGFFIFLLFGCKAITILYVGFGLLYLLLFELNNRNKFIRVLLSHITFGVLTLALFGTYLYPEIINLTTAMSYQGSLKFDGISSLIRFFKQYIEFIPFIPVLVLLPYAAIMSATSSKKIFIFLILSTLVASLSVLAQNRFSSPYHYLSFIPIIVLVYLNILEQNKNNSPSKFFSIIDSAKYIPLVIIFIYTIFQNFNNTTTLEYASNFIYKKYFIEQTNIYSKINATTSKNTSDPILLLTGDCPPYFIANPSASKKISAMPLNRSLIRNSIRASNEYIEYYNQVLTYNGKYILLDNDYLDLSNFPDIGKKLTQEYFQFETFLFNTDFLGESNLTLFSRIK